MSEFSFFGESITSYNLIFEAKLHGWSRVNFHVTIVVFIRASNLKMNRLFNTV